MRGARLERVAVFGATSGMARAFVRLLAERGASLFLVGRDPEKLEAVAADARVRGAASVVAAAADLDEVGRHEALVAEAVRALGRLDAVLVAQGVLADSDALAARPDRLEAILVGNFVGPASLCDAAARALARQGDGVLAGISSVAGDRGRQSNYAYGAAKAGFSTFLDGLRNRMHPLGVHVVTVKPGFVDSPMTAHLAKGPLFASTAAVGRALLRAMERRRDVAYLPGFWRLVMRVVRAIPEPLFKRMRM